MKKNLAVIFGGRSSEHEVSCVSVVTIAKAVDLEKYNMFLIGTCLGRNGRAYVAYAGTDVRWRATAGRNRAGSGTPTEGCVCR